MREPILAKILRYLVYIAAFVPLIIFKDYISPFHFGKVIIFRSLVEMMIVLFILLVWRERSYLHKITIVGWAFLFFAVAFSTATITSVIPYSSMWGSLERMGGVFTFWHYFIYFIILTAVFRKESDWINLFRLVIVIGVLSAFYGFGQKTNIEFFVGSGGRERIFGTIGNPALFAGYELLIVFLSLMMYLSVQKYKKYYLAAFAITSIAVLMTAVRGSLLGYAVGLTVFAFLWMKYKKSNIGRTLFKTLVVSVLLFIAFSFLFGNSSFVKESRYLSRITSLSFTSPTVQTRFWAWQAGLRGWRENPKTILLGWGPENFNIPFSKNFNPKFFAGSGSETLFDRAHNMFVEVLVTMGIIGLLAYVYIFIAMFAFLRKFLKNNDLNIYGIHRPKA